MLRAYVILAAYNGWANARLYGACAALAPETLGRDEGAFFGSLLGTLNHLVVTDRIWLDRFEERPGTQPALDTILAEDIGALRALRAGEDARLMSFVGGLDGERLLADISYANSSGRRFSQSLASALDHLFNHQAHHRGQAHGLLTRIGGRAAAPSLDLIVFQREGG